MSVRPQPASGTTFQEGVAPVQAFTSQVFRPSQGADLAPRLGRPCRAAYLAPGDAENVAAVASPAAESEDVASGGAASSTTEAPGGGITSLADLPVYARVLGSAASLLAYAAFWPVGSVAAVAMLAKHLQSQVEDKLPPKS